MSAQDLTIVAAVSGLLWLLGTWLLLVSVKQTHLPVSDSKQVQQQFWLDDAELFRKLVPEAIYEARKRSAIRLSIGAGVLMPVVAGVSIVGGDSFTSPWGKWGLYAFQVVLLCQLAYAIYRIYQFRKLPHLLRLGPNPILENSAEKVAFDVYRGMRWLWVILAIGVFVAVLFQADQNGLLLGGITALACALMGFRGHDESLLFESGVSDVRTCASWRSIVAYHWYPDRHGVVFVYQGSPLGSPLMILPIPTEKIAEVEQILAERLPDKRGDDLQRTAELIAN